MLCKWAHIRFALMKGASFTGFDMCMRMCVIFPSGRAHKHKHTESITSPTYYFTGKECRFCAILSYHTHTFTKQIKGLNQNKKRSAMEHRVIQLANIPQSVARRSNHIKRCNCNHSLRIHFLSMSIETMTRNEMMFVYQLRERIATIGSLLSCKGRLCVDCATHRCIT